MKNCEELLEFYSSKQLYSCPFKIAKVTRMAKTIKTAWNVGEDGKQPEVSYICPWGCKMIKTLWETFWQFIIMGPMPLFG